SGRCCDCCVAPGQLHSFPTRRSSDLGAGKRAALIEQRLRRRADRRGFSLVGYVPYGDEESVVGEDVRIAPEGPLAHWAVSHRIEDRKSTRLNSSHVKISYAVFCLKKK